MDPESVGVAVVLDNFSAHVSADIRAWAGERNVELAFVPFYASWLNPIEAQSQAAAPLRHRWHRPRSPA